MSVQFTDTEPKTQVKARGEVKGEDFDIYLDDTLVAFMNCKTGLLTLVELCQMDYDNLNDKGIPVHEDGHIAVELPYE